jgi:hypothetical protein
MECLEGYARDTQPEIGADKPRAEQCAEHVKNGLRAIALQTVLVSELVERSDSRKRRAQSCVMDESTSWEECIEPAEIEEVKAIGGQRQRECEAWEPELASCILNLPGARNCEPDEYPLWRKPRAEGPPGPAIAWSIDLSPDDDLDDEAFVEWGPNRTLIVRDDRGLRAIRDGRVAWETADDSKDHVVAGGALVARAVGDGLGLRVFDLGTGRAVRALDKVGIETLGAAADRVLVYSYDQELYEVTPARCTSRGCVKKLGEVADGPSYAPAIGAWRDHVALASSSGIDVVDRRGKPRFALVFDDNHTDTVQLAGETAIVGDNKGVAMLSLPACAKLGRTVYLPSTRYTGGSADVPEDCEECVLATGGCIVAQHDVSWVSTVTPKLLPGGAIAFNDHGIVEKTQYFEPRRTWATETDGYGGVAGDDEHVYLMTFGLDGAGPARVLALGRDTGKAVWQSELPGADLKATEIQLSVRDHALAVRVGSKVYVLELARRA